MSLAEYILLQTSSRINWPASHVQNESKCGPIWYSVLLQRPLVVKFNSLPNKMLLRYWETYQSKGITYQLTSCKILQVTDDKKIFHFIKTRFFVQFHQIA